MKNVTYISAGAGSGKTFRLTKELTDAFAKENIRPSQVILTTFTKLAAGEFKEKARKAILENKELKNPIQWAIELDTAAINTIHGIALDFIKRYWYLLDLGADIQIMPEDKEYIHLNQSLADIVKTDELEVINAFNEYFGLKDKDEDVKGWQKDLNDIIEKMKYYNVEDVEYSRKKSIEEIEKVFCGPEWTEQMVAAYQRLLQKYTAFCMGKTKETAKDAIHDIQEHQNFWNNYTDYKKIAPIISKVPPKDSEEFNSEDVALSTDFEKYANSRSYSHPIKDYVSTLFHIAQRWKKKFDEYKKENHILTYNDIELNFYKLLETQEEVRDEIRHRYKRVMVDEFQDCNPIQLKIFNLISELVAENGGRSIWVGDAKQAIYGFRGSDAELVADISRKFPNLTDGLATDNLSKSWRSREPLVNLVNEVFHSIFTSDEIPGHNPDSKLPTLKDKVEKNDLVSLQPNFSDDLEGQPAIQHWLFTAEKVKKEISYKGLCHQIKACIASGLPVKPKERKEKSRCITYKDIAILTDSNRHVNEIVKIFRAQGIPVSTPETNILQRKETKLVITLLEYFLDPTNKHIRADLDSLINGKPTEEILEERLNYVAQLEKEYKEDWKTKDLWLEDDAFFDRLKELKNKVEKLSISEIVTAVIYELDLPGRVCQWKEKNIRQQNLCTIQGMARQYDEDCVQMGLGATLTGFLNYLRTTSPSVETDNTSDTVKVMTYHKSKGLEWPVVILDALDADFLVTKKLIKHEIFGIHQQNCEHSSDIFNRNYWISFFPNLFPGNTNIPKAIEKTLTQADKWKKICDKCASEKKHLLYVGMTRARDYLISTSLDDGNPLKWLTNLKISSNMDVKEDDTMDVWGTNHKNLFAKLTKVNVDSLSAESNTDTIQTYSYIQKPDHRTIYPAQYVSPSTLAEETTDSEVKLQITDKVSDRIHLNKVGSTEMNLIGTCIHNFMAVYQPGDEKNGERARRIITNAGLQEVLNDQSVEGMLKAAEKLRNYLTEKYGPATSMDREMPFYHQVNGQIVHGEMDLVWNYEENGEPRCVLLDYKTFPGGQSQLEEHTRRYIPQLRAYRAALHQAGRVVTDCLIYYVVEGSLVKVEL